jgi:hypothetical protein
MLFEADFTNDEFNTLIHEHEKAIRQIELPGSSDLMFLAYRLAKYAQQNKYSEHEYLNRPFVTVKILLEELQDKFDIKFSTTDVTIVLLDYVVENSYLLTVNDVFSIFGVDVYNNILSLQKINKIVNSRAIITPTKIKTYDMFSRKIMIMKTAIIIAELQMLELNKAKRFPIKVYERYIPMFSIYSDVSDIMMDELKVWLLQKIKVAQSDKAYSLTTGDLYKYFEILKAQHVDVSKLKKRF